MHSIYPCALMSIDVCTITCICSLIDTGDISEQVAIREKLKCKPFKWFMEKVAFDLKDYYPPVEPKPYASGEVSVGVVCYQFYGYFFSKADIILVLFTFLLSSILKCCCSCVAMVQICVLIRNTRVSRRDLDCLHVLA